MTLPEKYSIRRDKHFLTLFREGREVWPAPNKAGCYEALEEVAEWHARERAACVAWMKAKFGSVEQDRAEALRKEAERKMVEAQKRCR